MDTSQDLLQEETLVIINFTFFIFTFLPNFLFLILLSQSLIHLNSVQLMSIMDHFGYATRPLVEFNLSIYTDRASFLGWLNHMSERKRLAITLDPASSEPARFKNKSIQASMDMIREESEPEVVPISPPSSTKPCSTVTKSSSKPHPFSLQALKENQLARIAAREAEREKKAEKKADSEDEYRPPIKKAKGAPPDLKLGKSPTPVPMERLLMLEVNVLNIFFQGLKKLQTLALPLKLKNMTRKVTVTPLLTVKCHPSKFEFINRLKD